MSIENDQDEAEARLPENAKAKAHQKARERVLYKYLGITEAAIGKFRSPG